MDQNNPLPSEPEFTADELRDALTPEQLCALRLQRMATQPGEHAMLFSVVLPANQD